MVTTIRSSTHVFGAEDGAGAGAITTTISPLIDGRAPSVVAQLAQGAAQHLFVELGELARDGCRAIAEDGDGVVEAGENAMRRLEEDQSRVELGEPTEEGAAFARARRREAEHDERVGRQPRDHQRGERRRGARRGAHGEAGAQPLRG